MTILEIHRDVNTLKPRSLVQVKRDIKTAKIKPLGARQRPQQYPSDSAARILKRLGIEPSSIADFSKALACIPSMKQLHAVKRKARR